MAKYIDADTVVGLMQFDDYGRTVETDTIENILDNFTEEGCPKPADVAPVVHGEWIPITSYSNVYKCSKCGRLIDTINGKNMVAKHYPYCHCGAKMDEHGEG